MLPFAIKENNVLFPMADRLVPDDVAVIMVERFEAIERDRVGEGKHEAYALAAEDKPKSHGWTAAPKQEIV